MGDPGGDGAPSPEQASHQAWDRFLTRALRARLDPDQFADFVPIQQSRHPLAPGPVADLALRPNPWNRYTLDTRLPLYLQALLDHRAVDLQAVLAGLFRYSTMHTIVGRHAGDGNSEDNTKAKGIKSEALGGDDGGGDTKEGVKKAEDIVRWENSLPSEEIIFYRLRKAVTSGSGIRDTRDALEVCFMLARWTGLFTAASAALPVDEDPLSMGSMDGGSANKRTRDDIDNARAAFIIPLLGVCENPVVLQALSRPVAKGTRKALSQGLANFVPSLMQNDNQIAARLELFRTQTLAGFEPVDKKKQAANAEMDELLDETLGLQNIVLPHLDIARSRAGLYVYLNAALIGRPLLDDSIYDYLHNRFEGDVQSTAIDFILASFDVLANAIFRNEGQKSAHLLRSYLINKVPLILAYFAATVSPMYPFNSELCITNALGRVDSNTFPTLSGLFENESGVGSNPFTESVRSDFVTACCLHGLVPESSIDKLIGDYTYQTLPAGGRYVKDKLVEECNADQDRMLRLITELDKMDGNAGAVCQALTEMLRQLCANKETITLKRLCSQLARNPLNLDVLLLFDKATTIVNPLCELMDNWRYEDDQGEYQPVYEEFGSILLLLLAFVYRYNLSASDLGIRSPDSFIAKLLGRGQLARPLDELSDQEKNQLNGWIHGLFDNDGGGLADELLSSCPPQSLYMLIPTLFHNIVLAYSTGYLTEESLKTGVEYLVDPFLLPCLVTAMMYLSNRLWTDRPEENKAIIKILQLILRPSQKLNPESSDMLNSVKNIVAKPLENGLRTYQRQNPKSQDVEPLLNALKGNIELSRRTGAAADKELESWTNSSGSSGGLTANIRHTIHNLTMWSVHAQTIVDQPLIPTAYTHRQMLVGLRQLGAKRVLYAILEELKQQTEAASGSAAYGYDVAVALVCAPDVTNAGGGSDPAAEAAAAPSLLEQNASDGAAPQQRRLTLREALRWAAEEWKKVQKTDPALAEIIVRLHQRVEKQMAPAAALHHHPGAGVGIHHLDAAGVMGADDAAAAAAMVAGDPMALDSAAVVAGLDLSGGAGDLGLGGAAVDLGLGVDAGSGDWGSLDLNDWDPSAMDLS